MIRSIVSASIRFRLLVLTLAAAIVVIGFVQLPKASLDALPEFAPPFVEVQTEALGLSAEEVEQLITVPLEADLLNGVQDVDVIRSESMPGLSRIVMVFKADTSLYEARSRVQEKLTQAHALPQVSKPPTMLQPLSSSSRLLMVSMASDTLTPIERSVLARWVVRPRIMGIPGVANVAIWGQRERQLQVQVDPEVLLAKGVTLEQVISSAGNAQIVSPLTFLEASTPGTGGFIETVQQRLQVRHVFDKFATTEELGKIPVDEGKGLRLRDVATIVEAHQPMIGDAIVGGEGEGLLLVVEKFPNADPAVVTLAVEDALEELRPGLAGVEVDSSTFRAADYVDAATANLRLAGLLGLVLLIAGVGLWLLSWRAAAVTLGSVVVSLTAAGLVLQWRNETFNALTFLGLAAGAVLIAYDAAHGVTVRAGAGSSQNASAVPGLRGYALAIGLASIVPVAMVEGRPGAFMAPAVSAYVVALLASFVVALTLTPALASFLGRWGSPAASAPLASRLAPGYLSRVSRLAGRPIALIVVGVLALVTLAGGALVQSSLVPALQDRNVLVSLDGASGSSLATTTAAVTALADDLQGVQGVEAVAANVGRAITGDQISDVNTATIWIRLAANADYSAALTSIAETADKLSGYTHDVVPYSSQRLRDIGAVVQGTEVSGSSLDVLTGSAHPLTVRIYGEDLTAMLAKAGEVHDALTGITGVVDPRVIAPKMEKAVEITVDLDRAAVHGIKPGDVRRAEATLVQGIQVGSIFEGQKVFDVIVQGTPATRASVDAVSNLLIEKPAGGAIRLSEVADITTVDVPERIDRDAVARRVDVVADLNGLTTADAAAAAQQAVDGIAFPLEHHAEVLISSTAEELNLAAVIGFALAAVLATFLILQAAVQSWKVGALAFLALVAAVAGGVLVALVIGGSLGAWAGMLALVGIAARTILLFIEDRSLSGSAAGAVDAARQLAAVLGTALGVALLSLPAAFMGAVPGLELIQPLALVVLGGLVTTTAVALLLPGLAPSAPALATAHGQGHGAEAV
ncbi:MAG TPA: efflux RND transporter permease subunit [Arachnia sp.]|nr:efflux RND transporter permease subunit [Arachnia sp.]